MPERHDLIDRINNQQVLTVINVQGRVLQMAPTTKPKKPMTDDPQLAQAVQSYEAGLRAMQEHKFDKAKTHLQKVIAGPSPELADRARTHLNVCNQHVERIAHQFKTPEEHYDYAVSLMNLGDYVSVYLAFLNDVYPTPVDTIFALKDRMKVAMEGIRK